MIDHDGAEDFFLRDAHLRIDVSNTVGSMNQPY